MKRQKGPASRRLFLLFPFYLLLSAGTEGIAARVVLLAYMGPIQIPQLVLTIKVDQQAAVREGKVPWYDRDPPDPELGSCLGDFCKTRNLRYGRWRKTARASFLILWRTYGCRGGKRIGVFRNLSHGFPDVVRIRRNPCAAPVLSS